MEQYWVLGLSAQEELMCSYCRDFFSDCEVYLFPSKSSQVYKQVQRILCKTCLLQEIEEDWQKEVQKTFITQVQNKLKGGLL